MIELFEEFYKRYERPEVERLTIGFSGIDPPEKQGTSDHEELDNLLGGDIMGHYHLTGPQLEKLSAMFQENYPPTITTRMIRVTADEPMSPYTMTGTNTTLS